MKAKQGNSTKRNRADGNRAVLRRFFFPQWSRFGWSVALGRWVYRLGWLPVYRHCVWREGRVWKGYFIARSAPQALMTGPRPIGVWFMGKSEFENGECKGNKWLVPINRELDVSRD